MKETTPNPPLPATDWPRHFFNWTGDWTPAYRKFSATTGATTSDAGLSVPLVATLVKLNMRYESVTQQILYREIPYREWRHFPQNPSASPVLEVAPLLLQGISLCRISPKGNSLCASLVLEVAPLLKLD